MQLSKVRNQIVCYFVILYGKNDKFAVIMILHNCYTSSCIKWFKRHQDELFYNIPDHI